LLKRTERPPDAAASATLAAPPLRLAASASNDRDSAAMAEAEAERNSKHPTENIRKSRLEAHCFGVIFIFV
jgi:hypothetical protein